MDLTHTSHIVPVGPYVVALHICTPNSRTALRPGTASPTHRRISHEFVYQLHWWRQYQVRLPVHIWYWAYRFRLSSTPGMWLVLFKLGQHGQQRYGPQSTQAETQLSFIPWSCPTFPPPGLHFHSHSINSHITVWSNNPKSHGWQEITHLLPSLLKHSSASDNWTSKDTGIQDYAAMVPINSLNVNAQYFK